MKKYLPILVALTFLLGAQSSFAASRFWVGGTGTWDAVTTTHWSATSGGSGGASVPATTDDVFFNASSGGGTITIPTVTLNSITFTGFTGSLTETGSRHLTIGSITMASTVFGWDDVTFSGSGVYTITTGGNLSVPATFSGTGTWTLQDTWNSTGTLILTSGTLNLNNQNTSFSNIIVSGTTARTLSMGSGTMTLAMVTGDSWNASTVTNFTFNANTSTILMNVGSTFAAAFKGGGLAYNTLQITGTGTGTTTISGSNSFNLFKDDRSTAHIISFTNGTTQTFNNFLVSGSSGKLVTITSDTTATHALVFSGTGRISSDFLNIQHSIAAPTNTWYAGANSTNNQGVTTAGSGWIFTTPPLLPPHATFSLTKGVLLILKAQFLLP